MLTAALLAVSGCASAEATSSAPPTATPPSSGGYDQGAAFTALAVRPVADVDPVLGADNRIHLAYELLVVNQTHSTAQLSSVATLDADHGDAVIGTRQGADLDRLFRPFGGETGTALAPGEAGNVFFDVTLPAGAAVPRLIHHRFALTLQAAPPPQEPDPQGADVPPPPPRSMTFTGVPVTVSTQQAVELAPPLQGTGWVAGNGCCDPVTVHRGALLAIDGTVFAAQRFAIDFIQLNAAGQIYAGNPADNASFPFFGTNVHAVADGTVVRVLDGQPEQTPGKLPDGQTPQTGDGNYVVLDIGNGRFAFYAHMQPHSLTVKVGDRVHTGDVLGLLGNTGNTDTPHLHFHVMDGPSPLLSNGLPYVFTHFTGRGVVTDEGTINPPFPTQPATVPVDAAALAGPHTKQLPLNLEVVDFS